MISLIAMAQKGSIEGDVYAPDNTALEGATAILMQQQDSVMAGFALTTAKGRFLIEDVELGSYVLQISFLGYSEYYVDVTLDDKGRVQLDPITMAESDINLDEIIVEGEYVPVRMRQDTVEYNAGAFKVSPNADVEELLKKLPGVEVQKDGSIKAHGENVGKVLVEGKEFFGDDPTIATKNLPADAVDKVQVFDKKSEMAEFTGIDDGNEQRTINLALKEDKKNGFFGNGKLGYGSDDRWEGKFNTNSFGKKAQMSIIGSANNINEQAFGIDDYIDLMGGFGAAMSSGVLSLSGDDFNFDNGQGFTDAYSVGLNYNRDFSKEWELQSNYFFSRSDKIQERSTFAQNFLDQGTFTTNSTSTTENINNRHRANFTIKHKIDSLRRLTIRTNIGYNYSNSSTALDRLLTGFTETPENRTTSTNTTDRDRLQYGVKVNYSHRFGKNSRILSFTGNLANDASDNTRFLNSVNAFLMQNREELIDQRQLETNDQTNYELGVSYTEPLGKRQFLEARYSRQNYDNDFEKNFFDIVQAPNVIETLNQALSDAYNRAFTYDRLGLTYKRNRKAYSLSLGAQYQLSNLDGQLASVDQPITKTFRNLLPSGSFRYTFNNSTRAGLNYRTSISEPSLEQLQPITTNTDPLVLYIGNPDLNAAYNHILNFNFNTFSSFSNISFFVNGSMMYTKNRIVNSQIIDENFVQTITPVNVANDYRWTESAYFSAPIKFLDIKVGLDQGININRSMLFINGVEDMTTRTQYNVSLNFSNRKAEKIDWTIGARITYNDARYDANTDLDQDYFDQNFFADVSSEFAKGWFFETSMDYKIFSEEAFGERTTMPLWKAEVSKTFLKNERGQITLAARDLLNRNLGINRINQLNFVQDERVVSLGRYFMLSFGYKFSGFGGGDGSVIQFGGSRR